MEVESDLDQLERRVSDLIELAEGVSRDNESLRDDQRALRAEFETLREKNEIAHGRVERIVARLESMESLES